MVNKESRWEMRKSRRIVSLLYVYDLNHYLPYIAQYTLSQQSSTKVSSIMDAICTCRHGAPLSMLSISCQGPHYALRLPRHHMPSYRFQSVLIEVGDWGESDTE